MKRAVPFAMLLVAASVSCAFADSDTDIGTVDIQLNQASVTQQPIVNGAYYSGPYTYNFSNESLGTNGSIPSPQAGFCIDYTTDIGYDKYSADVYALTGKGFTEPGDTVGNASPSGDVYRLNQAETNLLRLVGYFAQTYPTVSLVAPNPQDANLQALQLAMWSIIDTPPFNLNGTSLSTANNTNTPGTTIVTEAQQLVTNSASWSGTAPIIWAIVPNSDLTNTNENGFAQIQGIIVPGNGGTVNLPGTPEPVGLTALASLGLCGFPIAGNFWFRRRRKIARS